MGRSIQLGQTISHYSSTIMGLNHNYKAQELPETDMAAAQPAENTPGANCDQTEALANCSGNCIQIRKYNNNNA